MTPAAIGALPDVERLAAVQAEVVALETQAARFQLAEHDLPVDDAAVNRLVFARYLFITLRLREHGISW